MDALHVSVLLHECIDNLNIRPDGIYVDGTLGMGGHSEQIAARLTPYGRQKRPRLRGLSDEELVPFMRRDMAAREPYYAQAQLTVDCTVMADDEVVVRILKWLEHGE